MTQLKLRTVMESIMMFDAYSGDKKNDAESTSF